MGDIQENSNAFSFCACANYALGGMQVLSQGGPVEGGITVGFSPYTLLVLNDNGSQKSSSS